MKKNILFIVLIFIFSNVCAKGLGETLLNWVLGEPKNIYLKDFENYTKDRIYVNFYKKFGRGPNKKELDNLYKKALSEIVLNFKQIEEIEEKAAKVVKNYINTSILPENPDYYPLPTPEKMTLNQLPEYVSNYVKKRFNLYYDPRDIQGYNQMLENIIYRARAEAFAGYTNDGQQIIDELIWKDKLNSIIEEESYILVYYVEPTAPAWDE